MSESDQTVSFGFADQRVPIGGHICYIYADEAERRTFMGRFVESGFASGEKVVYLADRPKDELENTLLELAGHSTRVVPDGLTAIEVVQSFRPHAIFLDIGLPGIDGYAVARRLREASGAASALLVAVTGYGQTEDRHRSEAAGFDHHLVKPVEWNEVERVLRAVGGAGQVSSRPA